MAEESQTSTVTSIEDEVAAMVGLSPNMLDDEPEAPATLLRVAAVQFITTLRQATAGAHDPMARMAESSMLNAVKAALMTLGD